MSKKNPNQIGNVYRLEFPEGGGRPDTIFLGKVFNRTKEPENPRKVLSLDKSTGRNPDGTWQTLAAKWIVYEDGSKEAIDGPLVLKLDMPAPAKSEDFSF